MKNYEVMVKIENPVVYGSFFVKAKSIKDAIKKAKKEIAPADYDCVCHKKVDFKKAEVIEIDS